MQPYTAFWIDQHVSLNIPVADIECQPPLSSDTAIFWLHVWVQLVMFAWPQILPLMLLLHWRVLCLSPPCCANRIPVSLSVMAFSAHQTLIAMQYRRQYKQEAVSILGQEVKLGKDSNCSTHERHFSHSTTQSKGEHSTGLTVVKGDEEDPLDHMIDI